MSLNIKNDETYRLTQELSKLTGESLTTAVTVAVQERLERIRATESRKGLAEQLMEIAKQSAPLWEEPWKSTDHGDLLYDAMGLPK